MRITKKIIYLIAMAAVDKSNIPEREMAILKKKTAFADKLRKRLVPASVMDKILQAEEVKSAVNKEVDGLVVGRMFNFKAGIRLRSATGLTEHWDFDDGQMHPIPQNYLDKMNKKERAIVSRLFAETDEVYQDKKGLVKAVSTACASVTTTDKLLQVWPEAAVIIPEAEKKVMLSVPSQAIEDMIAKKY